MFPNAILRLYCDNTSSITAKVKCPISGCALITDKIDKKVNRQALAALNPLNRLSHYTVVLTL